MAPARTPASGELSGSKVGRAGAGRVSGATGPVAKASLVLPSLQVPRRRVSLQADLPESAFRHALDHAGGLHVSVELGLRSTRFRRTTKRTPV